VVEHVQRIAVHVKRKTAIASRCRYDNVNTTQILYLIKRKQ